jgi:hypothetical protein
LLPRSAGASGIDRSASRILGPGLAGSFLVMLLAGLDKYIP